MTINYLMHGLRHGTAVYGAVYGTAVVLAAKHTSNTRKDRSYAEEPLSLSAP